MRTRRRFLKNGIAATGVALFGFSHEAAATPLSSYGCCLPDLDFDALLNSSSGMQAYQMGSEPIIHHSGNDDFDRALAHMLASITHVLNVLPGFGFYDDGNAHNAYANPKERLHRTDGTVLFGLGLLSDKLRERESGARVAAVCAHEYGHILQFTMPGLRERLRQGQSTVKTIELHADFLAGYFAATHKEEKPEFPAAEFAVSQRDGGDPYVGSEQHHGTREERGNAVVAGFKARKEDGLTLAEAVDKGVRYVRSL